MRERVRLHTPGVFPTLVVALIGLAWLTLWVWGNSPYSRFLSHQQIDRVVRQETALVLVFVGGWTLMTVAMMLPTSLPLISMFHTVTQRRPDRVLLVALLLAGYVSVWTLFGILVHLADGLVHLAVARVPWLAGDGSLIGALMLLVAGAYQFTPLKYHCLSKCRSPRSFIFEHWRGRDEQTQAFRLGVNHGLFCVGCCWTLMLLMFAVGVGNIGWMLALGVVMAIEKNLPWGRRLSAPLGVMLLGWGALLALQLDGLPSLLTQAAS